MDEMLDVAMFNNMRKLGDEIYWVEVDVYGRKQKLPYKLISSDEKPTIKFKVTPNKKDYEGMETKEDIKKKLGEHVLDYIDPAEISRVNRDITMLMITKGINASDMDEKTKTIVKEGLEKMKEYDTLAFENIVESIETDMETITTHFLDGQETQD